MGKNPLSALTPRRVITHKIFQILRGPNPPDPFPTGRGSPLSPGKGWPRTRTGYGQQDGVILGASIHPYPPAGYHPQNFSNFAGPESAGPLPNGKGISPFPRKGVAANADGVWATRRGNSWRIAPTYHYPTASRGPPLRQRRGAKKQWRGKRPAITLFYNKPDFIRHQLSAPAP